MNNLDKILDRINGEADGEVEKINAEAANAVNKIKTAADNRISDINTRAESTAMKEYQSIISRAESSGAMAEREIILKAKSGLIDMVYRDAENAIRSLPKDEYASVMSHILADAILERINTVREMTEVYGDEEFAADAKTSFEVLLGEDDLREHPRDIISGAEKILADIEDVLVPKIKLSKVPVKISGGFIVRYGDTETNCSISAMVDAVKEKTYTEVASVLFK